MPSGKTRAPVRTTDPILVEIFRRQDEAGLNNIEFAAATGVSVFSVSTLRRGVNGKALISNTAKRMADYWGLEFALVPKKADD